MGGWNTRNTNSNFTVPTKELQFFFFVLLLLAKYWLLLQVFHVLIFEIFRSKDSVLLMRFELCYARWYTRHTRTYSTENAARTVSATFVALGSTFPSSSVTFFAAHLVNRWCQSLWADPWGLYSYELELLLGIQDKERHHGGYSFVRSRSSSGDRSCANIAVVQVWFSKCSHTHRTGYFFVRVVKQGFHIILEYHKRKKRRWVQIRLSKNLDLCVLLIKWLWNSNTEYTLSLKNPNILSKSLISFSVGVNKSRKSM